MRKTLHWLAAAGMLALGAGAASADTKLKAGDMAPDFTLPSTTGKQIHLADYRGKKSVVLAFYVLAFTGG